MKYLIGNININYILYRYKGKELSERQFKYLLLHNNEINEAELSDIQNLSSITIPASTKFEKIFKNGFYKNEEGKKVINVDTICEILKMESALHLSKIKNQDSSERKRSNIIKTKTAKILNILLLYNKLMKKHKKNKVEKYIKLQNELLMKEFKVEFEKQKMEVKEEFQVLKRKMNI